MNEIVEGSKLDPDEIQESGGIVTCPKRFADKLTELADLFDHKAPTREAARFAMAIGIQNGSRLKRAKWGKGKVRNIAHLSQFTENGVFDIQLLFEMLDLIPDRSKEEISLNNLISEYIASGMKWIVENELDAGTNFSQLKSAFPHLFSRES